MNDLISIIVPVYNSEKYLTDCLNSICNQTYKNLQIILVDDCSEDISGDICEKFAKNDNRIEVFHLSKNKGQSGARNEGVKQAKGEWISFVDNDDTIDPDFINTIYCNAVNYDVKVSGCGNTRHEDGNTILCNLNNKASGKYKTEDIVKNILIRPNNTWVEVWSKLFHKSLKSKLDFPENCQLEDYMVVLPLLLEVGEVYFDNKSLYNWIVRDESQSKQDFFENRLSYFDVTERLRNKFIELKASEQIVDAAYVWEYCVKAKLIEDMVKTKDSRLIKVAKEKYTEVKSLKEFAYKSKDFRLKSRVHVCLRLLRVKFA